MNGLLSLHNYCIARQRPDYLAQRKSMFGAKGPRFHPAKMRPTIFGVRETLHTPDFVNCWFDRSIFCL
jgi:hypothetical protein